LLILCFCGTIFSAYDPNAGFEPWHFESLAWIAFLSMIIGTLLCAALLANEFFEVCFAWHLNREGLLGDTSDDPSHRPELLAYSKSATAYVLVDSPKKVAVQDTALHAEPNASLGGVAQAMTSKFKGAFVYKLKEDDEDVSIEDTKLFYHVNLLRFRTSIQRRDPSERFVCAPPPLPSLACSDARQAMSIKSFSATGRFQASMRHVLRSLRPYVREGSGAGGYGRS
jgi:hypothetical protein